VVALVGGHGGKADGVVRPGGEDPPGTGHTFASFGSWLGSVDGRKYVVFAGAKTLPSIDKAVRSEVLVYYIPSSRGAHPVYDGAFTPPDSGRQPLRITAAHGDILTIETSTGASLHFDVAMRSFE
jgi:hypothetical protein